MSQEMVGEFRGRQYVWSCDPYVEGMLVFRLFEESGSSRTLVLEAKFYLDHDAPTFTAYRPELPFEMIEWFVLTARQMLPQKPR